MASIITNHVQVVHSSADWMLEWNWPPMAYTRAVGINAWIASLNGQVETFRFRPTQPYDTTPLSMRYTASIGYQYNKSVVVGGWAANAESQLFTGQYLQIGEQLLMITAASAVADANGRVIIEFAPWLRLTYPPGTTVNFVNPAGVFRLAEGSGLGFTLDPDRAPTFGTLRAVEAV